MKAPVIVFLLFLISFTGLRSEDKFDSLRVYIQNNDFDKATEFMEAILKQQSEKVLVSNVFKCLEIFNEEKAYYSVFIIYNTFSQLPGEYRDILFNSPDTNIIMYRNILMSYDSLISSLDTALISVFDKIIEGTKDSPYITENDEEITHKYDSPQQFYDRYMELYQEYIEQNEKSSNTDDSIYNSNDENLPPRDQFIPIEIKAQTDMQKLAKTITYPEEAKKKEVEGAVYVSIWVDENGIPQKPKVLKSDSKLLEEEAIRAIMNSVWKPAINDGKPVGMWVTIPISFRLKK